MSVEDYAPLAEEAEYRTSPQINEIFGALAKAQGEIQNATKDSKNPHFNSKYAGLASIADACRAPLSKAGIAVVQTPFNADKDIGLTTIFGHASGQWISCTLRVAPTKWDAQSIGSVLTYLRRYSLAAMSGVAPADDDDDAEADRRAAFTRPTERPKAAIAPSPVAPPYDPETGEVSPHTIVLQQTAKGPNWLSWGQSLIAGIKSATTIAELAEWQHQNATVIGHAAQDAPKAHRSVMAALDAGRKRLAEPEPEMVSETDAPAILQG